MQKDRADFVDSQRGGLLREDSPSPSAPVGGCRTDGNKKRRFLKPPRGIVFGDKPVNLSPGRYPIDCRFKERQLCPGRVSLSLLSNGFQCEWSPFYHCKDIHCRLLRSRYRDLDPSLHSIERKHTRPVAKIYRKNLFWSFHLPASRQGEGRRFQIRRCGRCKSRGLLLLSH
jgi:hypothetical protein